MVLSMLDRDVELAECEFLEETLIDDEENNDGVTDDDDYEFDTQLELPGETTLCIGSASSDEEVVDFLANGCGCTKRFNGPCSRGLTTEIVTDYRLAITELDSLELDLAILAQLHAGMNNGERAVYQYKGLC